MTENFKWGTIVPLIGGLTLAGKKVTGKNPDYLLTYTPFAANEQNVRAYFPKVPYYPLDAPDRGGFEVSKHHDTDFLQALCPCAGLSLLSSGTQEQRDKQNHWMLETAKFVTGELKPKVFWGENAPGLFSKTGERVRNQLREIGARNGYSFTVYATSTHYHGIPQTRKRTFYFFWRGVDAPVMEYYRRPVKNLGDFMREVKPNGVHHTQDDLDEAHRILHSSPYIEFIQDKYNGKGIDMMRKYLVEKEMKSFTLSTYLLRSEQFEECIDYLKGKAQSSPERKYTQAFNEATRIWRKVTSKGGFWDGSFPMYRGDQMFATLICRTLHAIHPAEDRCLTTRECMHLMGMPQNLKLVSGVRNHICQNVPVTTGSDMTREVIAFLKGERKSSGSKFVMQSNLTEKIAYQESSLLNY